MGTFISTERAIDAILDLLKQNQIDRAVTAYTSYQEDIGFQILGKVATDTAMQKAVANLFYRARDYPKAALCCENLGEHEKAALLYEKCQDYEMAADMYVRLNMQARAAEAQRSAGDDRHAVGAVPAPDAAAPRPPLRGHARPGRGAQDLHDRAVLRR
jgi:hypothetical protein